MSIHTHSPSNFVLYCPSLDRLPEGFVNFLKLFQFLNMWLLFRRQSDTGLPSALCSETADNPITSKNDRRWTNMLSKGSLTKSWQASEWKCIHVAVFAAQVHGCKKKKKARCAQTYKRYTRQCHRQIRSATGDEQNSRRRQRVQQVPGLWWFVERDAPSGALKRVARGENLFYNIANP